MNILKPQKIKFNESENIDLINMDRDEDIEHCKFSNIKMQNGEIENAGKNKLYINNPVHQNYGHIKALQEVLKLNEKKFISIVCMSGNAKLKIKSNKVVKLNDIIDKVKSYQNILVDNCEEIYNELRNINITDRKQKNKHNREIKKALKESEMQIL